MSRLDTIAGAFLRYLYRSRHFRPEVSGFLSDPSATGIEPPPSDEELAHVLTWLRDRELVATGDTGEAALPARAGLTGSGLICAGPYHGDIHAWSASGTGPPVLVDDAEAGTPERGGATDVIPPRSSPESRSGQETVSTAGAARVARVLLLTLPALEDERTGDQRARRLAAELLEATRAARPDPDEVRELARALRSELNTGPIAGTLGIVLMDGLDDVLDRSRPS